MNQSSFRVFFLPIALGLAFWGLIFAAIFVFIFTPFGTAHVDPYEAITLSTPIKVFSPAKATVLLNSPMNVVVRFEYDSSLDPHKLITENDLSLYSRTPRDRDPIYEELLARTPKENGPIWFKSNFTPTRSDTVFYAEARILIVSIYYDN